MAELTLQLLRKTTKAILAEFMQWSRGASKQAQSDLGFKVSDSSVTDSAMLKSLIRVPILGMLNAAFYGRDHMMARGVEGQIHADAMAKLVYFSVWWNEFNCPAFSLSPGLMASLAMSDCPRAELKLPFPAFAIQLPHPSVVQLDAADGKLELARIIDVSVVPTVPKELAQTLAASRSIHTRTDAMAKLLMLKPEEIKNNIEVHAFGDSGMDIWSQTPEPLGEVDLESWVTADDVPIADGISSREERGLEIGRRIAVNLPFYIESLWRDDEPRKPGKLPSAVEETRQEGPERRTYDIGREVNLPCPPSVAAEIGSSGWHVKARFTVRGHWRLQPIGSGRVDRKRIWIKPFWKGPRDAQGVINKIYRVDQV